MPISSSAAAIEKKKVLKVKNKSLTPNSTKHTPKDKGLLKVSSVLPKNVTKPPIKRAHSTIGAPDVKTKNASEAVLLQTHSDGHIHITRTSKEKEKSPDRLCLDRRGLTALPIIEGEARLRLLSLQHNLVNNLEALRCQKFPSLVFLDVYDNQLDKINCLSTLDNLRVLLIGKNRIKRIEGLNELKKLEVLDLHGNQIVNVSGLSELSVLKVLNLAGNQIRNIGISDMDGLVGLQELNLRRNRLKKLLGFGNTPNMQKLFLSNNEIQNVEDIRSIAKSANIKELSIDNNPISMGGDCMSFLVSYLPNLTNLNNMQVTEQVRKAAMAWRRNKECTNATFMDLTSDVGISNRREEVISNARTNWELLRTQTRCLPSSCNNIEKVSQLKPDTDIILTSLVKREVKKPRSISTKVSILPDKKLNVTRSNSQDTENSHTSSGGGAGDMFRLPPILVPIISKLERKKEGSLTSIGPNIDSSVSSIVNSDCEESSSCESSESSEVEQLLEPKIDVKQTASTSGNDKTDETINIPTPSPAPEAITSSDNNTETSSNLSTNTSITISSNTSEKSNSRLSNRSKRSIKSASYHPNQRNKSMNRAATAKPKRQHSPPSLNNNNIIILPREREQGGDYLIEICGRHLNVYGQGALRFVDKAWCPNKANDVNTVNFNYANFSHISGVLCKLKPRFPNAEHFVFKETNMYCLGQINALAEIQGLTTLTLGKEGNPIFEKEWEIYAVYRLSHWGLKVINGRDITEEEIKFANEQYQSLSDLVLWSLPDVLLQPLLIRLQIDVNANDLNPKQWLMTADPALRSVVSKEALQWKKAGTVQEDMMMRQKSRSYMSKLLQEMCNTVTKLRVFEERWPNILQDIVKNTLLDYSQLDMYMKKKLHELK